MSLCKCLPVVLLVLWLNIPFIALLDAHFGVKIAGDFVLPQVDV
jgi:hypothetical protein